MNREFEKCIFGRDRYAAGYTGKSAKVWLFHHSNDEFCVWTFVLTTPNGYTRDETKDYEEAKKLWEFFCAVVDAWDEYREEVD